MDSMFESAKSFNQDIGDWAVDSVTKTKDMFRWTDAFNQDISGWAIDSITDMRWMFFGASAFNQDIGDWAVDSVTTMRKMFEGASAFNQDLGWCVDNNVDMDDAFSGTQCASTSCGVKQGAGGCAPTPAPTLSLIHI